MNSNASPLKPGSTIGILGGGQLGRMLALAAARLGLHVHIYCPNEKAPAFEVAKSHTIATFDDEEALKAFARSVDVVTFEFENIPLEAADWVADITLLSPGRNALEISQDRATEKAFLEKLELPVADWWSIDGIEDLTKALEQCKGPALLKTRRLGYDGKGQIALNQESDPVEALDQIGKQSAILEKMVEFEAEVSTILVQSTPNDVHCYDIPRNDHQSGILISSAIPSKFNKELEQRAKDAATKIAASLDYRGALAVEFFVVRENNNTQLIINEFAPRVHNTGHWTLDACLCDQFENHIRAIANWPLGPVTRHSNAKMTNLLGHEVENWQEVAARPDVALHLYGKAEIKPGRKLGHMTKITPKNGKIDAISN